jgi:hypothetical protein
LVESLYKAATPKPGGLVIGIVHGQDIDGWFFVSLTNLLTALNAGKIDLPIEEVICVRSGPALQVGRGRLVNVFREQTDAEALLMLDDDMYFQPSHILSMWDLFNRGEDDGTPIDILGGLAFISSSPFLNQPGSIQPNTWSAHPYIPDQCNVAMSYPQNQLIRVGSTGAACVMIRRKVLDDIGVHHFHHLKILNYGMLSHKFASCTDPGEIEAILRKEVMDADEYGEDMSFFQRARSHGYQIHMHTGLQFGHSKNVILTEDDYLASQMPVVDAQAESETAP